MSAPPDTEIQSDDDPHEQFARPTVSDREIAENNFGAGYYDSSEVYQQTDRFKRTVNAQASVGQAIAALAHAEACRHLAQKGWRVTVESEDKTFDIPSLDEAEESNEYREQYNDATTQYDRRRDREHAYGIAVFDTLPDELQQYAIDELSTLDERFDPPEMRVAKFFHEASRSKGGRLMDNVFGRVKKLISAGGSNGQSSSTMRRLFAGGGGRDQ